jgi:hypothetical protein
VTDIPGWWEALLLALAAWRVFHLIAFDDLLDRPRRYVTRLSPSWHAEGDATGERYREGLAGFLTCPFCLGFWITIAVWAAWLVFPTETVWVAVPLALNAGLVGAQRLLSSE